MTIFGKIMAIFVFLLSLVWFGLTVNLYATRAEWRKAYDTARRDAERNAKDTEELKKQLQLERANVAGRQQAADQSVRTIAGQLKEAEDKYAQLLNNRNAGADAATALMPTIKEYDATLKKLQKQVGDLTAENATVTAARDQYAREAQLSKNAENNALLQAKVLRDANDALSQRLQIATEARAAAPGGGGDGNTFRGDVLVVSTDGSQFSFSGGLNAGVKKDAVYKVFRDSEPYYVGTVTVTVVNTQQSAGDFTPAKGTTASGLYKPKKGDRVEK